jgi:DNA-binding transcriptional MerR regulator
VTTTDVPVTCSIAEAAERSGLSAHTLRYYERDGLMLGEVERSVGGRRRYTEADLRWVHMLTCLRATGMPIREIRRYAELVRADDGNEHARLEMLRAHRERVLVSLREVTEHLGAIDRKIGVYVDRLGPSA